ncbi:MAG: DUF2203 domain-containing protein [Elusimicrobia bacterium]|nr:DUF2203 domain-containing protein [Elusimicrobiota bacterium]
MRHFTLQEAQAALPKLQTIFETAFQIKRRINSKMRKIKTQEAASEPDMPAVAIERSQLEFLAQSLREVFQEIDSTGAVLKGLDPALVDFPCRLHDGEIYLCWRYGEEEITHFHGIQEGFSGRRPLSELQFLPPRKLS